MINSLKSFIKKSLVKANKKKLGVTFIMGHHICSEHLEDDYSVSLYDLSRFIETNKERIISIDDALSKKNSDALVLTFDDGYVDLYLNVFPLCKKYRLPFCGFIVTDFIGKDGYVTYEQISEMINSGLFTLASHGYSHIVLDNVETSVLNSEILKSKEILEKQFNVKIDYFAYSHGKYNKKVMSIVAKSMYRCAFTASPYTIWKKYAIPRTNLELIV